MLQQNVIWFAALAIYCGLLLWSAISDFRRYLIPNQATLGALVLYPVYVIAAPQPVAWTMSLILAAVFFVIGFVLYATRTMGAGNVKMLPVVLLWVGATQFSIFIVAFALATVLLAFVICLKASIAYTRQASAPEGGAAAIAGTMTPSGLGRVRQVLRNLRHIKFLKLQLPYGVAIAAGGIVTSVNAVFTALR